MSWAQTIIGIFDKILETVQIEEFLMQINKDFLYGIRDGNPVSIYLFSATCLYFVKGADKTYKVSDFWERDVIWLVKMR